MGDRSFLRSLLQNSQKHPTVIGNVWMMALFIFRILVLGAAAPVVWADEQSEFICNSEQPGCKTVCYDAAFPLSHIRFWVLQMISVSTPTFIYLAYVLHIILREDQKVNNEEETKATWNGRDVGLRRRSEAAGGDSRDKTRLAQKDEKLSVLSEHGKTCVAGHMLRIYVGSVVFKILIELAFIVGQCYLYGFQLLPQYICLAVPCPHGVDCIISRSKEKTVFMLFMLTTACVSLLLNVLEICSLGWKMCKRQPKSPAARLSPKVERKAFTEDGGFKGDLQLEMGVAETGRDW
ncbi:gap junction alpha-3 protein-like [Tiliqua scincoides]|uniref:gap junction alpha-3 protein-like n=1 Tax=Tiliqua scincoides TaxID=71010 RepID=UPI0034635754